MKYESILIITYGRSGSTLLQGILNSIDGVTIRGENYNFIKGLYIAYENLTRTKGEFGRGDESKLTTSPWYGASELDLSIFIEDARTLVRNQLIGREPLPERKICYGFKEIRYMDLDTRLSSSERALKFNEYLAFLRCLFPNPAFVFLTREHSQVMASGWWKDWKKDMVSKMLNEFELLSVEYCREKDWVFQLKYEDMISNSQRVKGLFEFLGAEYSAGKVAETLAVRHSYSADNIKKKKAPAYSVEKVSAIGPVVYISVDPLSQQLSDSILISGVAIIDVDKNSAGSLILRGDGYDRPVVWGLDSPKVKNTFSNVESAGKSRFRSEVTSFGKSDTLELLYVNELKLEITLARIVVNR